MLLSLVSRTFKLTKNIFSHFFKKIRFYKNMKFQLGLIISAFYDALILWITLILLSQSHRRWLSVNKKDTHKWDLHL